MLLYLFLKQAAVDNSKSEVSSTGDVEEAIGSVESIASQIDEITISGNRSVTSNSTECSPDIDKRIRALKKKVNLLKIVACYMND